MADKRMVSKKVVNTDTFMKMPTSAQALYFHLVLNADDDGFVGNHICIRNSIGATESDLNLLVDRNLLIKFEDGIIVVRHWKMQNSLKSDRYHTTIYLKERESLAIDRNGIYFSSSVETLKPDSTDTSVTTEYRLGKDSIDKVSTDEREAGTLFTDRDNSKSSGFKKPTIGEIEAYIHEKDYTISPSKFYDFYESKGWRVGSSPMKNWKAAIRTWAAREKPAPSSTTPSVNADKYKRED